LADFRIADQDLAGRRGMLLGMTLAEVMLIILFCLLLILGKSILDLDKARAKNLAMENAEWAQDLSPQEINDLGQIVVSVEKFRKQDEPKSEVWRRMTDNLSRLSHELTSNNDDIDWQTVAEESSKRIQSLEKEIKKLKAGSPPPCLYKQPTKLGQLKGVSIPLGVIHIEVNRMTLVSKNNQIPKLNPVDYVGKPARYQEAYQVLTKWPLGKTMTLEEFRNVASNYVKLGDDETGGKLKCRFTMDYYIEDGANMHSMFVDHFLRYFYRQRRLTRSEFEKIG
jgi:hypothetical protein